MDMAADPNQVRQTVERYLALIEVSFGTSDEDLRRLADLLDELARLGRHTEPSFEDGHPDPPSAGPDRYKQSRDLAIVRFPASGCTTFPTQFRGLPVTLKP